MLSRIQIWSNETGNTPKATFHKTKIITTILQLVYSFTEIFDENVTQKQLFDQIGVPLVQDVLDGKNGSYSLNT